MSEEKKPYIILEAYSKEGMENLILTWLDNGYVPLGGVQVAVIPPPGTGEKDCRFYQTMVFNEAP